MDTHKHWIMSTVDARLRVTRTDDAGYYQEIELRENDPLIADLPPCDVAKMYVDCLGGKDGKLNIAPYFGREDTEMEWSQSEGEKP